MRYIDFAKRIPEIGSNLRVIEDTNDESYSIYDKEQEKTLLTMYIEGEYVRIERQEELPQHIRQDVQEVIEELVRTPSFDRL